MPIRGLEPFLHVPVKRARSQRSRRPAEHTLPIFADDSIGAPEMRTSQTYRHHDGHSPTISPPTSPGAELPREVFHELARLATLPRRASGPSLAELLTVDVAEVCAPHDANEARGSGHVVTTGIVANAPVVRVGREARSLPIAAVERAAPGIDARFPFHVTVNGHTVRSAYRQALVDTAVRMKDEGKLHSEIGAATGIPSATLLTFFRLSGQTERRFANIGAHRIYSNLPLEQLHDVVARIEATNSTRAIREATGVSKDVIADVRRQLHLEGGSQDVVIGGFRYRTQHAVDLITRIHELFERTQSYTEVGREVDLSPPTIRGIIRRRTQVVNPEANVAQF